MAQHFETGLSRELAQLRSQINDALADLDVTSPDAAAQLRNAIMRDFALIVAEQVDDAQRQLDGYIQPLIGWIQNRLESLGSLSDEITTGIIDRIGNELAAIGGLADSLAAEATGQIQAVAEGGLTSLESTTETVAEEIVRLIDEAVITLQSKSVEVQGVAEAALAAIGRAEDVLTRQVAGSIADTIDRVGASLNALERISASVLGDVSQAATRTVESVRQAANRLIERLTTDADSVAQTIAIESDQTQAILDKIAGTLAERPDTQSVWAALGEFVAQSARSILK